VRFAQQPSRMSLDGIFWQKQYILPLFFIIDDAKIAKIIIFANK
jgi:hypothetical protein